jgi:hypothetical protein
VIAVLGFPDVAYMRGIRYLFSDHHQKWPRTYLSLKITCGSGLQGVDLTGVIRVPESKDGFDNAKHERTLEGVGPRPGLGAGDGKTRCLLACSTALVPPPLALHLLLQRGEESPISPLGDELLRGAFNHPGLMQAQGVEA